jgi:peptide/nickel transport system substrate-binding protein
MTNNGNDIRKDVATLFQDDLKKVGVEVKIEIYEWAVFLKQVTSGDFDAVALGWGLPNNYDQYTIWHSSKSNSHETNYVGYQNPEVDRLLVALEQEYDRTKIIQLAGELQQIIYQDQPYLFLFVPQTTSVLQRGAYRICSPTDHGFVETPIRMTKAGWSYNLEWFYRTEYPPSL